MKWEKSWHKEEEESHRRSRRIRRMGALWSGGRAVLAAGLTLLMAGGPTAMAAESAPAGDVAAMERALKESEQLASKVVEPGSPEAVAAREQAEALQRSRQVTLHLPDGSAADVSQAQVYRLAAGATLVRVPITGLTAGSAVGYAFDANRRLTQTVEIHLIEHSATSGQARVWIDGRQVLDRQITEKDKEAAANTLATASLRLETGDANARALGLNWGKFEDCLNSAGIASWVISSLSTICSAACLVTAGAGCILCIAAAGGLTAGVVKACVDRAS
ncbi:hypothetical protein [Pyxidicoccus caerfyrddinensis]|uniref:hypothetical protein n=1 Tax=Pyxidicoccus caerfyrddinensis TaxID=2709663 RepID=UPI0013D9A79F|nr:hypothetical protein [Pyxidicoccus caerfyrddinensis]